MIMKSKDDNQLQIMMNSVVMTDQQNRELLDYINNDIFKKISVFHPMYAQNGVITSDVLTTLLSLDTSLVIIIDRNVHQDILKAIKKGSFNACTNRKAITAFLYWTGINDISISPYNAVKEQAFIEGDNVSGNNELELFNHLFDYISIQTIVDSFFSDSIVFQPKRYSDTSNSNSMDFMANDADFMYLYAAMLHLVYELRSGKGFMDQFEGMMKWYFQNEPISQPALTYFVLLFTKDKIDPPHKYMNNEMVFHGCKNAAMDIYYLQGVNYTRYPSDKYTFMLATQDNTLKAVAQNAFNPYSVKSAEEMLEKMCQYAHEKNRERFEEILIDAYKTHDKNAVTNGNHTLIADRLCKQEERQLKQLLYG